MRGFFNMTNLKNKPKKEQRHILRKTLRQQRNAMSLEKQTKHALGINQQIKKLSLFKRSKRIAVYLAEDGEIDPGFIIEDAWRSNKEIYLPVLAPFSNRLYFALYTASTKLKYNRFQILEPDIHPKHWLKPQQLGVILMPLVGFDSKGNRLGMGGGFYDRSLHFSRFIKSPHQPFLIGLAHQLQCVESLEHQAHDIPMQLIITESQTIKPI